MLVRDQNHDPTALPPKKTRYQSYVRLGVPTAGFHTCGKLGRHRNSIHGPSSSCRVVILSTLSRPSYWKMKFKYIHRELFIYKLPMAKMLLFLTQTNCISAQSFAPVLPDICRSSHSGLWHGFEIPGVSRKNSHPPSTVYRSSATCRSITNLLRWSHKNLVYLIPVVLQATQSVCPELRINPDIGMCYSRMF